MQILVKNPMSTSIFLQLKFVSFLYNLVCKKIRYDDDKMNYRQREMPEEIWKVYDKKPKCFYSILSCCVYLTCVLIDQESFKYLKTKSINKMENNENTELNNNEDILNIWFIFLKYNSNVWLNMYCFTRVKTFLQYFHQSQ